MSKKIKIAIYSGSVPSTTFIERLINGLAANGTQIFLFGTQYKKLNSKDNIHYYTYTNKTSKLLQFIKYSFLLSVFKFKDKKMLDKIIQSKKNNSRLLKLKYYSVLYHKPDIFHLQWAKGIEDWIWVKNFGIKLVLSLRGTHITISPHANKNLAQLYSQYFPEVDGFHAVSKSVKWEALKYNAFESKINVVYSGLPIKDFSFSPKLNRIEPLEIISVGRSHWTKGYSHALDALKLLKNNKTKFHYTIIGVEDDEELIFQRAQLGLEKNTTFLKKQCFDDVIKLMKKADVLLLPSVEEGIANVVLEAMALGTLVITSDCGGMNEVISDSENGFIVPNRNPEAMALALEKASQLSQKEYQKITNTARKTIEKQHNVDKMVTEMQIFYQNVLNKKI